MAETIGYMSDKQKRCSRCGTTENLTKDHIIPRHLLKILCVAEPNAKENLQILCDRCNKLKSHALDPKNPKTMTLLRKYVNRYEELYITKVSPRKKYVWRTLTVKSLNPNPTYMVSRKKYLEGIYKKQIGEI